MGYRDLVMPLGAAPHPMLDGFGSPPPGLGLAQINARDHGWNDSWLPLGGHGNLKSETFPDIYQWWDHIITTGPVPKGTED